MIVTVGILALLEASPGTGGELAELARPHGARRVDINCAVITYTGASTCVTCRQPRAPGPDLPTQMTNERKAPWPCCTPIPHSAI